MAVKKKKSYPEEVLIRLIRERHRKGAEALYDMYGASLYGVILRIVPDIVMSEDLLQECMLRIWQSFSGYDAAKGRLFTWMVNIARNLALDQLRSKAYRNQQKNEELVSCKDSIAVPEQSYSKIDQDLVRKGTAKLLANERCIIELIYYRGYTHLEAAAFLHIPVGTVKTRLVRAVKCLRVGRFGC